MRILFITNFYPPHTIGGMEHRCQEVVDHLRAKGYEVLVLTSIHGLTGHESCAEGHIHRLLHLEADMVHYRHANFFIGRRRQEQANLEILDRFIHSFCPNVVFVWGMWNLSRKIPAYLEALPSTNVVYSLASDWPAQPDLHTAYWHLPARHSLMKPFKALIGLIAMAILRHEGTDVALRFDHAICVSSSLRDSLLKAGVGLKDVRVIYPGIDLVRFDQRTRRTQSDSCDNTLSLLYAGALVPHKGVHTAIEAVASLVQTSPELNLSLTITGSGHPDYERCLKSMVEMYDLDDIVRFVPQIPRETMPVFMKEFDVLVFPSIWEEPFSRVVLEAMAMGLVVVATKAGGTGEILVDGVNGLAFEPEDGDALAGCISRLFSDAGLRGLLAARARETVLNQYDIRRMNEEIERYLFSVVFPTQSGPHVYSQ